MDNHQKETLDKVPATMMDWDQTATAIAAFKAGYEEAGATIINMTHHEYNNYMHGRGKDKYGNSTDSD